MRLHAIVFLMALAPTIFFAQPLLVEASDEGQWFVDVETRPRGLSPIPTPPDGWYAECSSVTLEAPPIAWYNSTALDRRYTFYYWKIDGQRFGENLVTIHMDANHTAIAVYVRGPIDPVGDVNYDGHVDLRDLAILSKRVGLTSRGPEFYVECDLNKDGKINIVDLAIAAMHFGE